MSWCFVTHLPNKRTWPWNFYFFCFQEQFFFSQSSFLSPGCVFAEIEMSPVFYFISSSSIPLLVHTGNVEKVVLMNDFLHEHPFWRWTCSVPDQKRLKSHSKYTWHFLYFSIPSPLHVTFYIQTVFNKKESVVFKPNVALKQCCFLTKKHSKLHFFFLSFTQLIVCAYTNKYYLWSVCKAECFSL